MSKYPSNAAENNDKARPIRRSDYWTSVLVLAFVAAFFITVVAVCYSIIVTPPPAPGTIPSMAFPWIGWFAALLVSTALIVGFAQYMARKTQPEDAADDTAEKAWANQLPDKALHLYQAIRDAPLFVVCFALIALGATLLAIDGAFTLISGIVLALIPYAPYFIGGVTAFAITIAGLMAWFRHANNRLAAEYAFRREVMEKTGIILLNDKGKAILPPGGSRDKYAIGSIAEIPEGIGPVFEATPIQSLPQALPEILQESLETEENVLS